MQKQLPAAQRGFSLLEAIVAMVLLATVGMALFSWINTSLIGLNRAEAAAARSQAINNALEYMEQVNPAEQPDGMVELGALGIKWQSSEVEPLRDGMNPAGSKGFYRLGLYDTEVKVFMEDNEIATFSLRQAGYRQVVQWQLPR